MQVPKLLLYHSYRSLHDVKTNDKLPYYLYGDYNCIDLLESYYSVQECHDFKTSHKRDEAYSKNSILFHFIT